MTLLYNSYENYDLGDKKLDTWLQNKYHNKTINMKWCQIDERPDKSKELQPTINRIKKIFKIKSWSMSMCHYTICQHARTCHFHVYMFVMDDTLMHERKYKIIYNFCAVFHCVFMFMIYVGILLKYINYRTL